MQTKEKLFRYIENSKKEMIALQRRLTAIPAISPESGGDGEWEKAEMLIQWLREHGLEEIELYHAPDPRVSSGKRPNIVVTIPGKRDENRLWIMSHLDIVPPGDESLWAADPYNMVEKDGRLYGRGVEDNQQGLVSSVFAALAFVKEGLVPENSIKLLFIADEETGSTYGIKYLLEEHDLFAPGDRALVPDGGTKDGTMVEIAEKSTLWLEITTAGKQCHASRPEQGINAFLAASELVVQLSKLGTIYDQENNLFKPPYSTFSPTKKKANVPNINTIPGEDVFCFDSRILPEIPVDDVLTTIESSFREIEKKHGVSIRYEIKQRMESKATSQDDPFVRDVEKHIREVHQVEPEPAGIGGGTVGAYLRNRDIPTVVWSTLDNMAHAPNEYCVIDNMLVDAKIMALLMA